jgi:hypothetical protein
LSWRIFPENIGLTRGPLNNINDVEKTKVLRVTMLLNQKKKRVIKLSIRMTLNMKEFRTTIKFKFQMKGLWT